MFSLNCTICYLDGTFPEPMPNAGKDKYYFIHLFDKMMLLKMTPIKVP